MKSFGRKPKTSTQGGGKPFGEKRSWGRNSDSREPERKLYRATCDECQKTCEVPFKPTGTKPVFCSSCFSKDNSFDQKRPMDRSFDRPSFGDKRRSDRDMRGSSSNDQVIVQLKMINDKLDALLRAMK